MSNSNLTTDDVCRLGDEIYQREIRSRVEPDHLGEFVVVDIETGDFEVDTDHMAATDRLIARHPAGRRYLVRIGDIVAFNFGGSARVVPR